MSTLTPVRLDLFYAGRNINPSDPEVADVIVDAGSALTVACHMVARQSGWWNDPVTMAPLLDRNVPELLMLTVSELAEGMEAYRKDLMDDKLPARPGIEVELADAIIRCFDLGAGLGLDVAGAIAEKLAYNATREDHRPENRVKPGGKRF